jgi:hypothetical protein
LAILIICYNNLIWCEYCNLIGWFVWSKIGYTGGKYLVSLDTVEIAFVRQTMNEHVHERQWIRNYCERQNSDFPCWD